MGGFRETPFTKIVSFLTADFHVVHGLSTSGSVPGLVCCCKEDPGHLPLCASQAILQPLPWRLFRDVSQQVIKEDNLQKNSQEVGTYMLLKFAELRDEFDIVGDVRGKGLMIGIEMVQDKVMICSCLGGCLGPAAGNCGS